MKVILAVFCGNILAVWASFGAGVGLVNSNAVFFSVALGMKAVLTLAAAERL